MDKDQIIKMAREVGFIEPYGGRNTASDELLERFAAAIRAATKEEDAKICEERAAYTWDEISDACDTPQEMTDLECHECAAAIRASK